MLGGLQPWFLWALVSMVSYGIQSFLNVQLMRRRGDKVAAQVVSPAVVSVGALVMMGGRVESWGSAVVPTVVFAVLQGLFYFWTTRCRLEALQQNVPSGILFPLLKTSTLLVVILSAWVLHEWEALWARPLRIVGIALSLIATFLLVRKGTQTHFSRRVLLRPTVLVLIGSGILASAGASLMAKGAFNTVHDLDLFAFILLSNLVTTAFATVRLATSRTKIPWNRFRTGIEGGFLIGLFNFLGLVAFMTALKHGELAVVASINSLYILIPTLFGWGMYRERLPVGKHLAIALTVLAMVFLSV